MHHRNRENRMTYKRIEIEAGIWLCNFCGRGFSSAYRCEVHEQICSQDLIEKLKEVKDETDLHKWFAEKRNNLSK